MKEIVSTNVIASQLPENRVTGMQTAHSKSLNYPRGGGDTVGQLNNNITNQFLAEF